MTDPTRMVPAAGGPPPSDPPTDPPTGGPGDGDGGGGMDRRLVAILGLLGAIVVLLAILLIVVANDDGGDDDVPATSSTTTTTESTTTTEAVTSTTQESTTTTAPATTTTTESTTTTTEATTTTTTAPPPTIAPARCVGTRAGEDPDDTAIVFYDAWTIDDTECAGRVATDDAVDTLFTADGSGADWTFEGCFDNGVGEALIECAFRYEGGAAFFEMQVDGSGRWQVAAVRFRAD